MYGTCGRIDNKADFDFLTLTFDIEKLCASRRSLQVIKMKQHAAVRVFVFIIQPNSLKPVLSQL